MVTVNIIEVDLDAVLNRLQKVLKVTSDRALSDKLGLSTSGIAMSRKKNVLPYAAIVNTCMQHNVSTDEIFGITGSVSAQTSFTNESEPATTPAEPKALNADDLLAANAMVEKVLEQVLSKKQLPPERELLICKKLRPALIKAVFEHNFNEIFIRTIAEGALIMA